MIMCPKCNKELSDGVKFCDSCGTQIPETISCPNCGKQTSAGFPFCQSCGAPVAGKPAEQPSAAVPAAVPAAAPAAVPAAAPAEKKKFPMKAIMFGGIGVAVVAVVIIVISLLSGLGGKSNSSNYALYMKDSEIFFTNMKKGSEAWQLTSRFDDAGIFSNRDLIIESFDISLYTLMSEDGKYIFFPDKFSNSDSGINLYYKEVAKPESEAIKIDSDIQSYSVNTSATLVTYIKGEEGGLYQYKIGEDSKDKIASEVVSFMVSDDGKKICYYNSENSIYLKNGDEEKEKIASDVSCFDYVTEDLTTVYYTKDDTLYMQAEGEDKVKIASDVDDVLKIYESGEIYYLTSENKETSLMDYVIDDMKDADASVFEPTYPDYPASPKYPYSWDYDTLAEYYAARDAYEDAYDEWQAECDRLDAEYDAAYDLYWEKEYRDMLREDLEKETMEQSNYSLCFYNGTEETVITDSYVGGDYSYHTTATDAPVIYYEAYNQSSFEKVKLSEIESIYDVEYMVEDALFSSSEKYIAVKEAATVIEQEKDVTYFNINSSGTVAYYIDDVPDDKNYGDLYCISITDGVVEKPEVYDTDVYNGYCCFVGENEFEYFKDCKDGKGELYINKNKIDYDVSIYDVDVYTELDKVFYFTDWSDDNNYGTLKVYNGEEAEKIADDVNSFAVTPDGRVLYLYDYSYNYYKGELHEWSNGETRKIDDDVVCVLPFLISKYRGME